MVALVACDIGAWVLWLVTAASFVGCLSTGMALNKVGVLW